MMKRIAVLALMAGLGACAQSKYAVVPTTSGTLCLLQPFVRSPDGSLARADMEGAIAAGFRAADTNGDGMLDFNELTPLNNARVQTCDQNPFVAWSGDGKFGIAEYAARFRTAFDMADTNEDGFATHDEMLYAVPKPKRVKQEIQPGTVAPSSQPGY